MGHETDEYKVREMDGVTVVRLKNANLTGILEVNRIREDIEGMIEGGVRKLVVDFKHVEHCGSAGLGLLISVNKRMQATGGKMILSHPENVDELLRVSKTRSLFTIAADPKVALGMF
jgi:anti-anti-sigma factor